MRTDLKRWPRLVPSNRQMSAGYPSRNFVIAFLFSVITHLFIALLLWNVAADRIAVKPSAPSIGKPLFVSLTTLPSSSHEELDSKSEAETVVTFKDSTSQVTKAPEGRPFATDTTTSINLEALNHMEWNFGNIPEFKAKTVDEIIIQGVSGSGDPGRTSLSSYLTPSYGLESVNRFEQMFGEISVSELQRKKIEWRVDYIKNYKVSMPPDCSTYYANKVLKGLFTIPFLIKDAVTDNDKACIW